MKLHLSKLLFAIALAAVVAVPVAEAARIDVPVEATFYAGPYSTSFILQNGANPTNDILFALSGNLESNKGVTDTVPGTKNDYEAYVLNTTDNGITLCLSRANGISSTTIDNETTLTQIQNSSVFNAVGTGSAYALETGVIYTIEYKGGTNGSAAADLYKDGVKVAEFTGGSFNMNGGSNTIQSTAMNTTYDTPVFYWSATTQENATINYTKDGAWTCTLNGSPTNHKLVKAVDMTFGNDTSLVKNVAVTESLYADKVTLQDDYTFTAGVDDVDFDATSIEAAGGNVIVENELTLKVSNLTITGGSSFSYDGSYQLKTITTSGSGKAVVDLGTSGKIDNGADKDLSLTLGTNAALTLSAKLSEAELAKLSAGESVSRILISTNKLSGFANDLSNISLSLQGADDYDYAGVIYGLSQGDTITYYDIDDITFSDEYYATVENGADAISLESGKYYLVMTGTASSGASIKQVGYLLTVPEPTTATLSLLALAGLAARRRRK